jgi:hypothetical protein
MRKVTYTVYEYEELSEKAQERARDWYRETMFDYEWWDSVYYDAKAVAALMGIEIDDISFSGFYSQGDGAQFTGTYQYRKGSVQAVKEYAPQDETLHQIAEELYEIQKRNFYGLTATVKSSGRYNHEYCTDISVLDKDDEEVADHTEAALIYTLRDYMRWIYRRLEEEYEHLQSDEQVAESIIVNEFEFTEDGEPA